MKSGSHFEQQLQSGSRGEGPAASVHGGGGAGETRYGNSDVRGAGFNTAEQNSKNHALTMDKYSSLSGAAGTETSGAGFKPSMLPPPCIDRSVNSGPGFQSKGHLMESLFLAASSRLRGIDDEDSNNPGGMGMSLGGAVPSGDLLTARSLAQIPPGANLSSVPHFDISVPYSANQHSNHHDNGLGGASVLHPSSAGNSAALFNRAPPPPSRPSLASLLDVARNKRSYETSMCDSMASSSSTSSTSSGHGSISMASQGWAEPVPAVASAAGMMGLNPGMASAADAGSVHLHDLMSGGGLGGRPPADSRVGLLPGIKMEDYKPGKAPAKVDAQSRRSQREALSSLTAEEKLERRKERARMYSHIARKRQESNMRELKAEVESLSVYRLMIEEAPDMIAVLSPDIESRFLFANGAFARVLHFMPATLLGSSIWTIIHEQDKPDVMKVLGSIIMATHAPGYVRCRVKCSYPESWMNVDISMRYGRQGIICFLRAVQPAT